MDLQLRIAMHKFIVVRGEENIGLENSKLQIPTPALTLDLDALDHNIYLMTQFAKKKKVQLRPHCKGHKSLNIAKLQMKAGAVGISAATLGEAEVMVNGKISGVLITSPIVAPYKIDRLITLNQEADDLMIVVDHLQNVEDLSHANLNRKPLQVLIDFDIGQNRTGAKSIDDALVLAQKIQSLSSLKLVGIQAYGGHLQHVSNYVERQNLMRKQNEKITELQKYLQPLCSSPMIVTGGGTGTFDIDLNEKVFSEIQVGSYLFMDVQYSEVNLLQNLPNPFKPALFVLASVISTHPNFAVIDAGLKAFATDGPKPQLFSGALEKSSYAFMGDEHGKIAFEEKNIQLPLGHLLEFLTPHCDPTVNLYDFYYCVRGNRCVDIWPVDARGLH